MSTRLTFTNIAIIGVLQVGVIVAGVLGAGAAYKTYTVVNCGSLLPRSTLNTCEYGFLALAVPMTWITVAMIAQGRHEGSDYPEAAAFLSGVLVLLMLLWGAYHVAASPWLRFMFHVSCGGRS